MPSLPQYILALDQGATSSRAILFDRAAKLARWRWPASLVSGY